MVKMTLEDKYPSMTPVKSAPSLYTLNGCGFMLYGRRDSDPDTFTYVKTWCLTLVFLPVLCLRAYRVSDSAGGGWYFIGRQPLSSLARMYNMAAVLAVAGVIGLVAYVQHTSTPAYKARQQMAQASRLVDQGELAQAAGIYQRLALAGAEESRNAAESLGDLLDAPCRQASLEQCAGVYGAAARIALCDGAVPRAEVLAKGLKLVDERAAGDPRGGLAVMDAIRPLAVDTRPIDARRLPMLEKWASAEPTNLDAVCPLALLLDAQGDANRAEAMLLPLKDRLGDGEGARLLGMIFARKGDYNGAYALLQPYVESRLKRLHEAQEDYNKTFESLWDNQIDDLNKPGRQSEFHRRYEQAGEAEKRTMVQEYVYSRIKDDPELVSAQETLREVSAVVPVALELGIVMLDRAQGQADADARKKQLEQAEKVFLSIDGFAGESDEYRLSLAKVKYWLGKQDEGRSIFDAFLTDKKRTPESLLEVARAKRELGAEPEARKLAEDSYSFATSQEQRQAAAVLRSVCANDVDDEILWLQRANTENPIIKGKLAWSLGNKAASEGRDAEAEENYRKAIDAYAAQPRSTLTLNESAIAWSALYSVTGDPKAMERCCDCFQQAVELAPDNPILIGNAASVIEGAALADIIGSRIDLRALRYSGGYSLLSYLYHDQAGREEMRQKVRQHPGIKRALTLYQRLIVLSPKRPTGYGAVARIQYYIRDDAGLDDTANRVAAATFDHSDSLAEFKKHLSGVKDQQTIVESAAALNRAMETTERLRAKGGATLAVALCGQAGAMMGLDVLQGNVDANAVVALAEQADSACPSSATEGMLVASHLLRTSKRLCASDPEFAALHAKCKRTLGTSNLVVAAAAQSEALRGKIVRDPDFLQAAELQRKHRQFLPDSPDAFDWALMRYVDPAEAKKIAEIVGKTRRDYVEQSLSARLSPYDPTNTLQGAWLMLISGNADGARGAMKDLAGKGIPMPTAP